MSFLKNSMIEVNSTCFRKHVLLNAKLTQKVENMICNYYDRNGNIVAKSFFDGKDGICQMVDEGYLESQVNSNEE